MLTSLLLIPRAFSLLKPEIARILGIGTLYTRGYFIICSCVDVCVAFRKTATQPSRRCDPRLLQSAKQLLNT